MNLMHSGFLFVLFTILEAISGLTSDNSTTNNKDLSVVHTVTEKSQQENGVSESVKIITPVPPPSATNVPTADGKKNTTTTTTTSTTSTTTTTTTSTTSTTTTTPAPAPGPGPTPTPIPSFDNGTWVVRDNTTNTICIIAEMVMTVNITYPSNRGELLHQVLNIPKNTTVTGNCSKPLQKMVIHWGPGHNLQINFNANETTKDFYVSGLSLNVNATVLNDAKDNTTLNFKNEKSEFFTPLNMSYKCSKVQDLNLDGPDAKLKATLSMKDIQLEAYVTKKTVGFEAAQNCDTFDTPDIVPIAVGCALAVLVFVVLVAYLIGRKRSQNRGYLSM